MDWCRTKWMCDTEYNKSVYAAVYPPPCPPPPPPPPQPKGCQFSLQEQKCAFQGTVCQEVSLIETPDIIYAEYLKPD